MWNGVSWSEIGFGPEAMSVGVVLIHQLLLETVRAAASPPRPTPRWFATGFMDNDMDAPFSAAVYSLAQ